MRMSKINLGIRISARLMAVVKRTPYFALRNLWVTAAVAMDSVQ